MKKIIVVFAIIGVMLLTSCVGDTTYEPITYPSRTTTTTSTTTTSETTPTTTPASGSYGDIDINYVKVGSFGVYGSLMVNNYVAGVRLDENIQGYEPLYIINRVNKVSEAKSITTDAGETIADIPIRRILHNNDINSVLNITSTLFETLEVEKYNYDGTLTISGFIPEVNRESTITYIPDSEYTITCVYNTDPEFGYSQAPPEVVGWVTFDQDVILIPPDSFAPVWVVLNVPEGTEINPTRLWQLTPKGEGAVNILKLKDASEYTDKEKLLIELSKKGLTPDGVSGLFTNGESLIYELIDANYVAFSSEKYWEFWVEIALSSGKQTSGVTSQIKYRVGYKVVMR